MLFAEVLLPVPIAGTFTYRVPEKIEKALFKTLADGNKTADIGGKLSTTEFTDVVINNL